MYPFNKSNCSLSTTLINDYAEIKFIDDTRPSSPNESQKSHKIRSCSHVSVVHENYDDPVDTVNKEIYL